MYHLQIAWWWRGKVAESLAPVPPEPARGGRDHATVLRLSLRAALLGVTVGSVKSQTGKDVPLPAGTEDSRTSRDPAG